MLRINNASVLVACITLEARTRLRGGEFHLRHTPGVEQHVL